MLYSWVMKLVLLLALLGAPAAARKGRQDAIAAQRITFCVCERLNEAGDACVGRAELSDAHMTQWIYAAKDLPLASLGKCRDPDDECFGNIPPALTCSYDTTPYIGQTTLLDCSGTADPDGGAVNFEFSLNGETWMSESGVAELQFNEWTGYDGVVTATDSCGDTMKLKVQFTPAYPPNPDCFNGVRSCADLSCNATSQLFYPQNVAGCDAETQECFGTCELGYRLCHWPIEMTKKAVVPQAEVAYDGLNTNCDPQEQDNDA